MQLASSNTRREQPAAVLVVGGGIGGMRSALDLADAGLKVYLIEQNSCLGGRVAQFEYMFPQHDCVLCRGTQDHGFGCARPSISPAYIQNNQHPYKELLEQIGMERGRLDILFMSGNQAHAFANAARSMADRIRSLGPKPLKNGGVKVGSIDNEPWVEEIQGWRGRRSIPSESD